MSPSSRLIAVDIGNSTTKLGWFDLTSLPKEGLPRPTNVAEYATANEPPDDFLSCYDDRPIDWYVASVQRDASKRLENWLAVSRPADRLRHLTYRDLRMDIRVDFPEKVGTDRLMAAVAANELRASDRFAIVIDAGTAITVDLVATDGAFEGGVILPGFRLSAQALASGTNQLPLTPFSAHDAPPPVVGKNTQDAIRSGLFWGTAGAVKHLVEQISATLPQRPQVFITGGDLWRLAPILGQDTIFVPNMVLSGIALAASGAPVRNA